MATDTGVAEKANVEDDDDLDLGAWLEETCNNDDNDSLFGAGEDDQSSLFMGDGISAPGEHISSQGLQGELLRDDPFLFLPPEVVEHQDEPLPDDPPLYLPPEVVDNQDELLEIDPLLYLPQPGESQDNTLLYSPSLPYPPTPSLPPEPHLSLPPPPSEEVRASEAPDVSIFSVNSHARIVPNPEGTQLVTQENQAIDHPQVGDAPCHDAQEGHMHTQKPVILPTFPRPRELSEAPPIDDLNNPDIRRLVGWLHLRSKSSRDSIYGLLDMPAELGKNMGDEAKTYLKNPEYAIHLNGNQEPYALHTLKMTLVMSALSLLRDEGMGERWFGDSSTVQPRSKFRWPKDATQVVLHFAGLIYKLTRNEQQRQYAGKKRKAMAGWNEAITSFTKSPGSTPQSAIDLASNTNTADSSTASVMGQTPPLAIGPSTEGQSERLRASSPSGLLYASPQTFRVHVQIGLEDGQVLQNPFDGRIVRQQQRIAQRQGPNGGDSRPAKRQQMTTSTANHPGKVSGNADILYVLHFIRNQLHVLPRMHISHSGGMRDAGFDHMMNRCSDLGLAETDKVVVEVLTSDRGLQRVSNNRDWDEVVGRISHDVVMDGVVRVCIRLP